MKKTIPKGLYLVTPDWDDTARLIDVTHAAISGGAVCLQYRHKTAHERLLLEQVQALSALCQKTNTLFIVNDHIELARRYADGVHIGQDDGDFEQICSQQNNHLIVGVSCYDQYSRAQAAALAGADYVAFGAMYASPTKPHAPCTPASLISRAKQELKCAIACIGGITSENAAPLIKAGADLIAVISDLYNAPHPEKRARAFAQFFAQK